MVASGLARNRVPIHAPAAPSASTAASPRPSAMPPAATTGVAPTTSTTAGIRGKVATVPRTCPFPALRYNYVHSALDRPACHIGRGDSVQHDSARFLGTAHQSTRLAPEEGDNRNLFREAHVQPFVLRKLQI